MFWAILVLLIGLLLFPEATLSAAKDGALAWWTRVFPALTPYLILTGLALRAKPNLRPMKRLHPYAVLSFFLGALGGYLIGARVLGEGLSCGAIDERQAQRFSYAAGLMSPAFLLSVTGVGLFGGGIVLFPLCISVYAVALIFFFLFGRTRCPSQSPVSPHRLTADDLSSAIADGMLSILRIGGCILLCRVCSALLCALRVPLLLSYMIPLSEAVWETVLEGLLEMTGGCLRVAMLPLPLSVRLSLCVFFQMFGGASVLLQTRTFLRFPSFGRYMLVRFLMAVASALLCFGLCLLLPVTSVPAMAAPQEMLHRAESLAAILIPCAVGLLSAVLFGTLCLPHKNNG